MRPCLFLFFVLLCQVGRAQNLVPNGSFEEYDFCSNNSQGLGWANDWVVPQQGWTPDYFNSCSELIGAAVPSNWIGNQYAFHGDAYVGLYAFWNNSMNSKEQIYVPLGDTLSEGSRYVFSMYLSLADGAVYSVRKMGMLLTDTVPSSSEPLIGIVPTYYNNDLILDSKDDWVLLSDTITANGGEKYLTLGCFFSDSLCDTVYVGQGNPNYPTAYYYIDDVSLIPLDSLLSVHDVSKTEFVTVYPNPASGQVSIRLNGSSASFGTLRTGRTSSGMTLRVMDVVGRDCFSRSSFAMTEVLDVGNWPDGVYVVLLTDGDGNRHTQRLLVQH